MMRNHRSNNLTFGTVEKLGELIVARTYSSGDPFPTEAQLCEEYQVSRTVMREAIKMLTAKGMLSSRPRRGTTVTDEDEWNLLDADVLSWMLKRETPMALLIEFTQVRLGIEPLAAALAAKTATAEQIERIEIAWQQMKGAEQGKGDPLESDIAFHLSILEASNNRLFMQLDNVVDTALRISIRMSNSLKGVRIASIADHRTVLDAIQKGDEKTAERAMASMHEEALRLFHNSLQEEDST